MRRGLRSSTLGDNAPTPQEPHVANTQEPVVTTTMPETQPGVVYLQSRREVRKFFGDGEARLAEEFKEEIQRVWAAQPGLSEEAKLDILLCNIGPTVRAELRCQPAEVQKSADKSLSAIVRVFGESRPIPELLVALYSCGQRSGEPVRFFSHRVQDAYDTLIRRQAVLKEKQADDTLLRDQFVSGLQDPVLVRILKDSVHKDSTRKFLDLREEAIRWSDSPSQTGVANVSISSQTSERMDRLESLVETLAKQLQDAVKSRRGNRSSGYNSKGERVCFKCNKPGHIQRNCPGNA